MPRLPRLLALVALTIFPAVASAQMSQGPPTPLAVDLAKVAVGSWSKYNMTMGTMPPMSMKMALVKRSAAGNTLEIGVEGGALAAKSGNVTTQMTLAPGSNGNVQKLILQVGSNDPMELPVEGQAHQFSKPDPKTLVKEETVKVAAGSFKTKHYHDKTPQGDIVDYWVTDSVSPIGLVKMEATQKSNPMLSGPIKMELAAVGKDAKMVITKPAKPFDQTTLMKQMMGGAAPPAGP